MSAAPVLYYLAFAFPIFLLWASLQDFASDACAADEHHRVRRVGRLLVALGVVHLALAVAGVALLRQARAQ